MKMKDKELWLDKGMIHDERNKKQKNSTKKK